VEYVSRCKGRKTSIEIIEGAGTHREVQLHTHNFMIEIPSEYLWELWPINDATYDQ
jgi:hypothetical protein